MSPSLSIPSSANSSPAPGSKSGSQEHQLISKCRVVPAVKSTIPELRLSVSDLPMLSCDYIQKGLFFASPPMPSAVLCSLLCRSLSRALSFFPALAGRLSTNPTNGRVSVSCDDSGVEFTHVAAPSLSLSLLLPHSHDVPPEIQSLFPIGGVSYDGHSSPLASFQLTQLRDGAVFLACTVNHAIVDGTSFWNFLNSWAELCRSPALASISRPPDFRRTFFGASTATIQFPSGGAAFSSGQPLRERIFSFTAATLRELKGRANCGRLIPDGEEASSFQSLCAHMWASVTRARKHLPPDAPTTFRMAINCRHRLLPPIDKYYFGNAIQSLPTTAQAGELAHRGLCWAAALLHQSVVAHTDEKIRQCVAEWEAAPRCFPLGNPDGAGITMGSSPRFPMYDGNDFGWGDPVAVRSGKANKFDGKFSAFPGRFGGGSVDVEVCLLPQTMEALLADHDFMRYVSAAAAVADAHAAAQ